MNTVNFIIEGEQITKVVNSSTMSDEFVNRLIRTFMDLGWIMTEVKTMGFFTMSDEDTVHIEFELTESDGEVTPYELDEDSFCHLLTDEVEETPKPMGYKTMSNVSQA